MCLVGGFVLTVVANIPDFAFHETRRFEGPIDPFADGPNALAVPEAAYSGMGYADARTTGLDCAVSVVFLTEDELRAFEQGSDLPPPQLHCQRAAARLPSSIAAIYVQNEGQDASVWSFELDIFAVSHPRAALGIPAVALLFVCALGIPILLFERVLPKWMESIRPKDEDAEPIRRQEEE